MLKKAEALAKAGRLKEAEALYQKLLSAKRVQPAALRAAIAFHLRYTNHFRKAMPLLDQLLKARPNDALGHALAAEVLANIGRLAPAQAHANKAANLAPDSAEVRHAAAFTALQSNDFDGALAHVDHALAQQPDHRSSRVQRGWALLGLGQADAAADLCRDLFVQDPDDINVLGLYMDAARITAGDPIFDHMQTDLLPRCEKIGGARLSHLLKLIGKGLNDLGNYDAAIESYAKAKSAAPIPYDAKAYAGFVGALRANIARPDFFGKGAPDDRPLLIVGMPRSGSTLLERMLVGHPQVATAGESPMLRSMVQDLGLKRTDGPNMVRAIKQMPRTVAEKLAQKYMTGLGHADSARVIDKSLHNFELLGFLAAMLPKARILHITRDPMDTCVSCYMQNLSKWHNYTQNLDTLGHAYVQYRKLMTHWKTALPNPTMTVAYEDLIADTEGQLRKVIEFAGLGWDPACLTFQDQPQAVRTLSARQVQQPLYTSSIARWRRYEAHLDPLKKHLAPFYPNGFDRR